MLISKFKIERAAKGEYNCLYVTPLQRISGKTQLGIDFTLIKGVRYSVNSITITNEGLTLTSGPTIFYHLRD